MGNIYKNKIQSLGLAVFSFSIVYKMDYKCILCHHRQRAHKFSKLLLAFSLGFARKRIKSRFLISKVSAAKMALRCWKRVVRDLQVEKACSRERF